MSWKHWAIVVGCDGMYDKYELKIDDSLYPKQLLDLEKPPQVLYVIGNPEVLSEESLGIIGARKSTPYGNACAYLAGQCAAQCHIPVVSGAAIGCDCQGQNGALSEGGNIIVVPGSGADVVYPASSKHLFEAAWSGRGCVVSLEKWGTQPRKYTFPKRNPIIAALSLSLIIIEAALSSGTFSTAVAAENLGRNIYAIPGSIFSDLSAGCNKLIGEGAAIIQDRESLELQISLDFNTLALQSENTEDDDRVIKSLKSGPLTLQELADSLNLSIPQTMAIMVDYESAELVERLLSGKFSLTSSGYLRHNVDKNN